MSSGELRKREAHSQRYGRFGYDEPFIVDVPEIPGFAAHAPGSAEDAIRLRIDAAKEFGNPVPEFKGRRLDFCLTGSGRAASFRASSRRVTRYTIRTMPAVR
jgi:hypothetical protein